MRVRMRLRLSGRFDTSEGATVEITGGPVPLFRVRPLRRRHAYELPLEKVARGVIFDVVRAELAARKRSARGRR